MKKIAAILLTLAFLVVVPVVLAAPGDPAATPTSAPGAIRIRILPGTIPGAINPGENSSNIENIINNVLKIIFMAAALLVLIFLIIGAFQWIMSGGDKEAVGKARNRITHALIGLAILVLAFVILAVIGTIIGINFLQFDIPKLTSTP